jgi:SNF2 family DNA or RNA helicase
MKDLLVVDEAQQTPTTDQTPSEQQTHTEPQLTKDATLVKLLTELTANPENRCLVFSAYEASFKRIRDVGIHCELLQGTVAHVDKLRKQFQDGHLRVLCMNARHVGAGINLEAATHIILYHHMNAELERQMIGRAIRFERTKAVHVIHLAHEGEGGVGS